MITNDVKYSSGDKSGSNPPSEDRRLSSQSYSRDTRREDDRYYRDNYYDERKRRNDRRDDNYYNRRDRYYDNNTSSSNRDYNRRTTDRMENKHPVDPILLQQNEGIYIPPFKLRRLKQQISDKASEEYQRLNWESLKKSINGIVNKVNVSNIQEVLQELFSENIIRGKGLLVRAILKVQLVSSEFSNVYAALIAVINTRIPEIGELLLKRLILQFLRAYKRNDRMRCNSICIFIAHLVNQQVASEILAGQILSLLLENATNDSVELAISFVKECGKTLMELAPKIFNAVFETFRTILLEGKIEKRVQYMIEALFAIRRFEFKDFPTIVDDLDLIEDDDKITHDIELTDDLDSEDHLDSFEFDENFEENETKYQEIKKEILGEEEEEEEKETLTETIPFGEEITLTSSSDKANEKKHIFDPKSKTDQETTDLKRKIYLTIMSSLTFEECAHKLLKSGLVKSHEMEVCSMIIECCSQERTYLDYYGSLAERFCRLSSIYQKDFEECFQIQYAMLHKYETNRLRNIARLFSYLLVTDAISWRIFSNVKITEKDTTSSSRIFLKILFKDLHEKMGMNKLRERLLTEEEIFSGLFPKDNSKNVRFAINFWTLIELPQLSDKLREYLKEIQLRKEEESSSEEESDSVDSDSDTSSGEE
ncbi:hypothetical protein ABK040_003184 [Willaertia magna]